MNILAIFLEHIWVHILTTWPKNTNWWYFTDNRSFEMSFFPFHCPASRIFNHTTSFFTHSIYCKCTLVFCNTTCRSSQFDFLFNPLSIVLYFMCISIFINLRITIHCFLNRHDDHCSLCPQVNLYKSNFLKNILLFWLTWSI